MVGYVLLISVVLGLGVVVFQWMQTYVPREDIECPDSVSVFIQNYQCSNSELNFTLRNNGKFSVGGYFIYATNSPDQELATIDLSQNITLGGDILSPTGIKSYGEDNSMRPNEEELFSFNLTGNIYSVEILPIRFQEIENRKRLVSCTSSRIREELICG